MEGRDRDVNTILSLATAIEADWLRELFPEDLKSDVQVEFDAQQKRVLAAELLRFRDLPLAAKRITSPRPRRPRACWRRKSGPDGCCCQTGTMASSNGWPA